MIKPLARREVYGRTLVELADENPDIVALDADIAKVNGTRMLGEKYPERFFNMGCAEQNMIGIAAGLASVGKIPFASTFASFASMRACEQVKLVVAYPRLNVKIVAPYAGLSGARNGPSHHCTEDLAIMRAMPNMVVMEPADALETAAAIRAIAEYDGPVYMRLGRAPVPDVYGDGELQYRIGKANKVRDGKDVTLIGIGFMVSVSLEAAEELEKDEISCAVLDMHTVKPVDEEAIVNAARETGCIVTVEDHNIIGGLGGAVAEVLVEKTPVPMARVGVKDVFTESAEDDELRRIYGLTVEEVVRRAKNVIGRKDYLSPTLVTSNPK